MLLVTRDRVGPIAFSRLVADGLVHNVIANRAMPADVEDSRAVREYLLAPFVPSHAWLTGLAVLWIDGLCAAPPHLDLATPRGTHRTLPAEGGPGVVFHMGSLFGLASDPSGLRTATPARACIDALVHSPATKAIPATASALRTGLTSTEALREALVSVGTNTGRRPRVTSILDALAAL